MENVPGEIERKLDELSSVGRPLLGGWLGLLVLYGALLCARWRRGAIYGGIAAVAWLVAVLAFQQNLQRDVSAVDWPGSLDLDFLPALGFIIAAHIALIVWFIVRLVLDLREDRRPAST